MYCNKCGQETNNPRLCDTCNESSPPATKKLSDIDIDALSDKLVRFGILTCIVCVIWWWNTYSFANTNVFNFTSCLYSNDPMCSISSLLLGGTNKITYNSNFLWVGGICLIIGKLIRQNNKKSNELAAPHLDFQMACLDKPVKQEKINPSLKNSKKSKLKLFKYGSIIVLSFLVLRESYNFFDHSRLGYIEKLLGYQYDFKSGKKLIVTKRNGQYYYSDR